MTQLRSGFKRLSWLGRVGALAATVIILLASFLLFKVEKTFSLMNGRMFSRIFQIDNENGYHENNRTDILIMGLRGKGDALYGEYLTDTIMVLSIKTDEGKAALLSIPRDLFVRIPGYGKMEKINFAYAYGMQARRGGLRVATLAAERVTGIDIDYAAAVDFWAFRKIIDMAQSSGWRNCVVLRALPLFYERF